MIEKDSIGFCQITQAGENLISGQFIFRDEYRLKSGAVDSPGIVASALVKTKIVFLKPKRVVNQLPHAANLTEAKDGCAFICFRLDVLTVPSIWHRSTPIVSVIVTVSFLLMVII